jgi:hypothetical protein
MQNAPKIKDILVYAAIMFTVCLIYSLLLRNDTPTLNLPLQEFLRAVFVSVSTTTVYFFVEKRKAEKAAANERKTQNA